MQASKKTFLMTALPFFSGVFSVLGFAPYYFYPAPFIALIALFYSWQLCETTKQAALAGFMYGLGLFGVGIYWIYISLHVYGNMPALMAATSTFLLAAFLALFPAAVGAISKRLANGQLHVLVLTAAIVWGLSDWVRSWIFTGFPWLTMGYSQLPQSPLAGFIPVIGIYGVSVITLFLAGLVYSLFKTSLHTACKRGALALLVLMLTMGELLKHVDWTQPSDLPISVSLLQGNIDQTIKWAPEIAEHTLQQYLQMAEQSTAKLIVLPETAMPMLSSHIPPTFITRLKTHALNHQGDVLVGMVELENGEYFNSVLSFGSSATATYRKSHLVPFGEFIPFKVIFGWIYRDWLNMPLSDLSRGSVHQQPMAVAGEKVAVNICYEDVFGEEIIRQLPAATLLVNVSNDAWYGDSYAADQHMQFSQARALETGRMMLRATNTGATAIIDQRGHVIARAPHFVATALDGEVQGYSGSTPYVIWGNWPFIILSLLALILIMHRKTSVHA
jgi:apolipoprotein N-acyltransferase